MTYTTRIKDEIAHLDSNVVEAIELSNKKWFIGVQYHPEFNSTPLSPSPLFKSFLSAITNR